MAFTLSRRAMLRGLGGAVALPMLECMLDGHGEALAQGGELPRRYALVFAGQSIGGDQWERDRQQIRGERFQESGHFIAPSSMGTGYELTTPLRPLEGMTDQFSVVSNLRIPFNRNSTEGDQVPAGGAFRDFHGGGKSPLLCGVRSQVANFRCEGVTSDQALAQQLDGQTALNSLVLRAQPSWYLSGSGYAGRQYISYRGARDPIEAQTSPQIAWQSIFGNFSPEDGEALAEHTFRLASRRSILDTVLGKRDRLLGRVGASDRLRLERHFDELRDLERRISAAPPPTAGACQRPMNPGDDPPVGGDNAGSGAEDIAPNTGYSDEEGRAKLMADLIHMAFVCDLTRVATLQITTFQSHMNVFPITEARGTPIRADLHEVGHNGDPQNRGQLAVSLCLQWHIDIYAHLVRRLMETAEGDGTVLDNCGLVFLPEGGHGTQLNDGSTPWQTHSVEDMVMLTAGGAGGLRRGEHIDGGGAHPVQGLLSVMQAAGFSGDQLGEVSGALPGLRG